MTLDLSVGSRRSTQGRAIAVTIHHVEPRTFQRAREIRAWLGVRGIDRVTLAVVPAADLHSFGTRSPILTSWLRAQAARGDAIAQHGLQHRGSHAEFAKLGPEESRGRVQAGLALLREVELDPHGFIAPAYGYTPALRSLLAARFDWFGERTRVRGCDRTLRAPALCLGSGQLSRRLSPAWARLRAPLTGVLMRLDIHPADFDSARHVSTLATILTGAADRQVVTYDDLFCPET
jgi:predicted deacetylase